MHLRREDGEFSTGAWVTAAFGLTGLAVVWFAVPIFEPLTALILFWVFIALALLAAIAATLNTGSVLAENANVAAR
jgi:putative effector of murein hydrolase